MTIDHTAHVLLGTSSRASRLHGNLNVFAERGDMDRESAIAAGQAVIDDIDTVIAELTAVKKRTAGELADLLSGHDGSAIRFDWVVHMRQDTRITVPNQPTGDAARRVAALRVTAGDWGDLVTKELPPSLGFVARMTSADREEM